MKGIETEAPSPPPYGGGALKRPLPRNEGD